MVMCDCFPLRIGQNLHPNLEIPLVAPTELGSEMCFVPCTLIVCEGRFIAVIYQTIETNITLLTMLLG